MRALVGEVLAAWRAAERVVDSSPPGPERERATIAALRLRLIYHDLAGGDDDVDLDTIRHEFDAARLPETASSN